MAEFSFDGYKSTYSKSEKRPDLNYFKITEDEGVAIVRFNYASLNDVKVYTIHKVGKFPHTKTVNCLMEHGDTNECPLCASGNERMGRLYVPLIEYVQDAQGNVTINSCIWERPYSFKDKIKSLIEEYGDLRDYIFKIKRIPGAKYPTYDLIPANPKMYTDEIYHKDFSAFNDLKIVGRFVPDRTFEDLLTYVKTGELPQKGKVENKEVEVAPYPNTIPVKQAQEVTTPIPQLYVAPQPQPQLHVVPQPISQSTPVINTPTTPSEVYETPKPLQSVTPTPIPSVSQTPRQPKRFGL